MDSGLTPALFRLARQDAERRARAAAALFHGVPVVEMDDLASLSPFPLVLVTLGYAERLADLARRQAAYRTLSRCAVPIWRFDQDERLTATDAFAFSLHASRLQPKVQTL